MELIITKTKENMLLSRRELVCTTSFAQAPPSQADTSKAIAQALGVSEGVVAVKKIAVNFGSRTATITAMVYTDESLKAKIEPKKKEKKKAPGQ